MKNGMFHIIGLNHLKSSLAHREKLHFSDDESLKCLNYIKQHHLAKEAFILSTCNRTEIYYIAEDSKALHEWLLTYKNIQETHIPIYSLHHQEAMKHSFHVASGLDSMAIGETQILSQLKKAIRISRQAKTYGRYLQLILEKSFSCAKTIRTQTGISRHHISIPSACLQIATNIFHNLHDQNLLFIGAGDMIRLCLTYFAHRSPKKLTMMNRTPDHVRHLAEQYHAHIYPLTALSDHLHEFDIIITSTGSPVPIITELLFQKAIKKRRHQPMLILDLAVPRDTESKIATRSDAFIYTIDDLSHITRSGMNSRRASIEHAEDIIDQHLTLLTKHLHSIKREKTIRHFRQHFFDIKEKELMHAHQLLKNGKPQEEVINLLAHRLMQKFLHNPSVAIRRSDDDEQYITQLWQL